MAARDPVHPFGRLDQHGAAVGARLLPVEGGHDRLANESRDQNTLWYSGARHAGASVSTRNEVLAYRKATTLRLESGSRRTSPWEAPIAVRG